jgi:hypothetical protein
MGGSPIRRKPRSFRRSRLSRKTSCCVPVCRPHITPKRVVEILGYQPKQNDELLAGRLLVALVALGEGFSTAELIDEVGLKTAIFGGAKAGGYWAAQKRPEGDGAGITCAVGEGIATVVYCRRGRRPAITDSQL